MNQLRCRVLCAALFVFAATSALAQGSDPVAGALSLLREGDAAAALQLVDRALEEQPRNASLRFARGVVLSEMRRDDEAIGVFTSLTEDHPELPDPYNNLAVLQARQGRIDQARESLEAAVRFNPGHAVAHENLGDLYLTLAQRSWTRAAQLVPQRAALAEKLTLVRALQSRIAAP